jgi:uridine kinase
MHSLAVGISGGSCSGKTSLAQSLVGNYGDDSILLSEDWYYRDLSDLTVEERAGTNFDHPDAIERDLLASQLNALLSGVAVDVPQYDFASHTRKDKTAVIPPAKIIVLEGLHVIGFEELHGLLALRIFIDTPESVRLARRIERDVRERGRTREQVLTQFAETVQPMHNRHVEPLRWQADIILSGEKPLPLLLAKLTPLIESRQG